MSSSQKFILNLLCLMVFMMKSHVLVFLYCGDGLCVLISRIFSSEGLLQQLVAEDSHTHLFCATALAI